MPVYYREVSQEITGGFPTKPFSLSGSIFMRFTRDYFFIAGWSLIWNNELGDAPI